MKTPQRIRQLGIHNDRKPAQIMDCTVQAWRTNQRNGWRLNVTGFRQNLAVEFGCAKVLHARTGCPVHGYKFTMSDGRTMLSSSPAAPQPGRLP